MPPLKVALLILLGWCAYAMACGRNAFAACAAGGTGRLADTVCTASTAADSLPPHPADTLAPDSARGRNNLRKKIKHTGNIFVRFIKSFDEYDTTYIEPNYYNYAAMLQNTNFYQSYRLSATNAEGEKQSLRLGPAATAKVGPYFGWRWIFLGYTFDVSHPKAVGKSTEFNLSLYSSMLGCDLVYIRNTGDFTLRKAYGFGSVDPNAVRDMRFDGMATYTTGLNVYYVFNHRHFSYPAAFAQSTVQRKSCGSWMLGFRFDHQKMKFNYTRLPEMLQTDSEDGTPLVFEEMKVSQINYSNYSVSGGYAYNWVFARNWLFASSVSPSIGFKKSKGERITGKTFWVNVKDMNFDFIFRLGLVWNNTRWFAGASLISHLYDYQRDRFSFTNSVNYISFYVGLNFNRRKQYRK